MRVVAAVALWLAVLLVGAGSASAASLQPVGTFSQPIYVTSDPTDPDRLFVAQREGLVIEVDGGGTETFADLGPLVSCCASERGLLSIALAPDFAVSGRLYAAYTGSEAAGGAVGDIHVDAFRAAGAGAPTREPIISIGHSTNANHNGGQLQFGPDGHLYISVGDGGGGGDPFDAGQSLATLLGKVLRIDPRPGLSPPYAIPSGNPFAGPGDAGLDEIWAYGLRNPWRFSFDRLSGDLAIADVGQSAREEVNRAASPAPGVVGGGGANYGWDCREGSIAYTGPSSPACAGASGFTDPVFDYPHTNPGDGSAFGCSITGGYVVRDASLGDLYGRYVYGDYCGGQLRSIDLTAPDPRATDRAEPGLTVPAFSLYSFGEDSCGRVYVVTGGGGVFRLEGTAPASCPPPPSLPPLPSPPSPGPLPAPVPLPAGAGGLDTRPRAPTSVQASAARQEVELGQKALILARISPCAGREGQQVALHRGGRAVARRRLEGSCLARFRPRVVSQSTFRVRVPGTELYLPARSARLALRPALP